MQPKKGEEIYIFDHFYVLFLANSCYKENCYFKMYLVLLLVKCEGDKNRFQKGVEKDLIALSEESIPVNTRQKAMWAYRLYEKWAQWRKDAYDPRVDLSTVGDLLMRRIGERFET